MLRRTRAAVLLVAVTAVVAAGCGGSCHPTSSGENVCESHTNWPAVIGGIVGLLVLVAAAAVVVALVVRSSRATKARRDHELRQVLSGPPVLGQQPPQGPPPTQGPSPATPDDWGQPPRA